MKIKAFTLQWAPESGFETAALDHFVAEHDVIAVTEHFFIHEGAPWWSLLVSHRPRAMSQRSPPLSSSRTKSAHEPAELAPEERQIFDALRQWRNDRARLDGKPPYVLFTNNQMNTLARQRPKTLEALAEVHGIGEAKCQAWGIEVLALMASFEVAIDGAATTSEEPAHVR